MNETTQKIILKYILQNPQILQYQARFIDVNSFSDPIANGIFRYLQQLSTRTPQLLSIDELKFAVGVLFEDESGLYKQEAENFVESLRSIETTEVTKDFINKLAIKRQLLQIANDLSTTGDNVEEAIGKCRKDLSEIEGLLTGESSLGFMPLDTSSIDTRIELYRELYGGDILPTGLIRLDEHVRGGGLRQGDLMVVMGHTGGGKTTVALNVSLNIVQQRRRVIYYILDNPLAEIVERVDSNLTQIDMDDMVSEDVFTSTLRSRIGDLDPTLLILKSLKPYVASVSNIVGHLQNVEDQVGKVDCIVVDSGDHLKARSQYKERRFELEHVYSELRGIAQEKQVVCITTTQGNRSTLSSEVVTLEQISEAYSKSWVASLFLTINQTPQEMLTEKARLMIVKNTKGQNNVIIPVNMNLKRMSVTDDMSSPVSYFLSSGRQKKSTVQTATAGSTNQDTYRPFVPSRQTTIMGE